MVTGQRRVVRPVMTPRLDPLRYHLTLHGKVLGGIIWPSSSIIIASWRRERNNMASWPVSSMGKPRIAGRIGDWVQHVPKHQQ
jgi:hypothetical protein